MARAMAAAAARRVCARGGGAVTRARAAHWQIDEARTAARLRAVARDALRGGSREHGVLVGGRERARDELERAALAREAAREAREEARDAIGRGARKVELRDLRHVACRAGSAKAMQ